MKFSENLDQIPVFKYVSEVAKLLKLETYVVGGFVRDLLLNKDSKDIDFVCIGSGIHLAQTVLKSVPGADKFTVYENFGTAKLTIGQWDLEFVGARKESYRKNSRKPIVEDGSLADDQKRRDFTINALAISVNEHDYGKLIDPFKGISDLRSKLIRTPLDPDITFSDDPLRMIRAIRFASQLEFDIEPHTFESITRCAERISIVSMERITNELNKIIQSACASFGFKLLFQSNLLKIIFPEMAALHGVETIDGSSHKDNFYHTLKVLDNISTTSDDLWLRWSAILHDIAKPVTKRFDKKSGWTFHGHDDKGSRMVPKIFKRLKLPQDNRMKFVQKMVRLHLRPIALVTNTVTDTAVRRLLFEAGDDLESLMKLCRADVTSKNNIRVKKYLANFDKVEEKIIVVEEKDRVRNFQPPVSGEEIMAAFNLKPGKIVGEIKEKIKEAILTGKIANDQKQALAYMKKIGEKKGLKFVNKNILINN